ncbi:MAG: AAA family ATPase [Oscillospiraceae bacterium]
MLVGPGKAGRGASSLAVPLLGAREIERITRSLAGQMQNIVLIGMPGCGKTTLGKALADRLGRPFLRCGCRPGAAGGPKHPGDLPLRRRGCLPRAGDADPGRAGERLRRSQPPAAAASPGRKMRRCCGKMGALSGSSGRWTGCRWADGPSPSK